MRDREIADRFIADLVLGEERRGPLPNPFHAEGGPGDLGQRDISQIPGLDPAAPESCPVFGYEKDQGVPPGGLH